ncbi:MAG: response regulator transcription factor [Chloroflexi bacterium]|nr:response regulator transcription factor [Chloroflexota bacterium]
MIRVMIVDDQLVVCEGIQSILSTVPNIEVVGMAHDGQAALHMIPGTDPDLVLMDLKMPGMNGIHATRAIREQFPEVRVLVLTTYDHDEWVMDALRAGADGYLLKDSRRDAIIEAIEGTLAGRTHIDPGVADKLVAMVRGTPATDSSIADDLNEREREILQLLAHGVSNAEIAERLHLAEGTVRNYVSNILAKLGVADRTQATALAWRYGLVE